MRSVKVAKGISSSTKGAGVRVVCSVASAERIASTADNRVVIGVMIIAKPSSAIVS